MLERHGYGVLLYDARGRGESEGSPNSYGWDWEKDAAGALDFLAHPPGRRRRRASARSASPAAPTLPSTSPPRATTCSAVVSDGAALRTFEDTRRTGGADPIDGDRLGACSRRRDA